MAYVPPKLDEEGMKTLSKLMNDAVAANKIPAVFVGATDAEKTLFLDCAGDVVCGSPESGKVDLDTTLQLFSATKLVTTVACLQLVDRGLVSLDDPSHVSKHLPELADFKTLNGYTEDGKEILEEQEPKGAITLRMLLSHTSGKLFLGATLDDERELNPVISAGLCYAWHEPVAKWIAEHSKRPAGFLAADATIDDYTYPLTFQPGTSWGYGIGLDWAAFLLERITGESIADYYRKNIFEPCGMSSTGFYPTAAIKAKLMRMTYYGPDSTPLPFNNSFTDGFLPRSEDAESMGSVLSGGAGLFGTARDYLAFLRGVLASSSRLHSPQSETKPLLSDTSFQELFKDVVSSKGKEFLVKMMKTQAYHGAELLEDESGTLVGHSVGLCLNLVDSSIGRKAGSGCWDGAAKTQYWLDPTTGIAGVCFSNIFATNPCPFMQFYNDYETALYKALKDVK